MFPYPRWRSLLRIREVTRLPAALPESGQETVAFRCPIPTSQTCVPAHDPAARITSIIAALDELLAPAEFADLGPNGLQVPGGEEVDAVVTGVSARRELLERAVELGAELVLVHHGLFWDFHPTG